MTGKFISFEGCEGCGKTTQIGLAAEWLSSLGIESLVTFEPGDGVLGKEIRRLLLTDGFSPTPGAELLLFLADRAQHVKETIQPALRRGEWVLCDRYSDSTLAYQMAGRGIAAENILPLLGFAEQDCRPDLTLWLDMVVSDSLARMHQRVHGGEDLTRLDAESIDFHHRVWQGYEWIWQQEPERICRIDAGGAIADVQESIRTSLADHFIALKK